MYLHFVAGFIRPTTNDPRLLARLIVLDGDSVLAHVLEPDKVERAWSVTMNTLGLILADDAVLEGGATAEEEDGIGVAYGSSQIQFSGRITHRYYSLAHRCYLLAHR